MPNWCEGELKMRGCAKDVLRFLQEGFEVIGPLKVVDGAFMSETAPLELQMDTGHAYVTNGKAETWIKGTHRSFCDTRNAELYWESEDDQIILLMPMKAAWAIEADRLAAVCKEYKLDMKIQAFEKGMQFSQCVEIIDGEVVRDEEIHYDNWDWDCPCALMGG